MKHIVLMIDIQLSNKDQKKIEYLLKIQEKKKKGYIESMENNFKKLQYELNEKYAELELAKKTIQSLESELKVSKYKCICKNKKSLLDHFQCLKCK